MTQYNPRIHNAPKTFSWGRLIYELKLRGVPAMIAMHSEPVIYDSNKPYLRLEIEPSMIAIQKSPSMEQLKESLKDFFGDDLIVEMVAGPATKAPAALARGKKINGKIIALDQVMRDETIQMLIKKFNGEILIESIGATAQTPKY